MPVEPHQLANRKGIASRATEDAEDDREHTEAHTIDGVADTTMWPDRGDDGYNPHERRPDGRTNAEHYERLWRLNAGLDGHTASGTSRYKADKNERAKRHLVENYAGQIGMARRHVERAKEVAADLDARAFGRWGGREGLALAAIQYAAPFDVFLASLWFRRRCHEVFPAEDPTIRWDGKTVATDGGERLQAAERLEKAVAKIADEQ